MTERTNPKETIAVIGGTGDLGAALAKRLALVGYTVLVGSRSEEAARLAADSLRAISGISLVEGCVNLEAATPARTLRN